MGLDGNMNKGPLVISIMGPPFSGKTYLTTNLVHDFSDFHITIYEKFFNKNDMVTGYLNFCNEINSHLANDENVIAESVYCLSKNPNISVKYKNILNILCWPSLEKYKKNYGNFLSKFGSKVTNRRLNSNDLARTRAEFVKHIPEDHITFDGTNLNFIKREINKRICG